MQSVTVLLGQLQEAFSKTFLFAGLLPALVALAGIAYIAGDVGKIQAVLDDLLPPAEESAEDSAEEAPASKDAKPEKDAAASKDEKPVKGAKPPKDEKPGKDARPPRDAATNASPASDGAARAVSIYLVAWLALAGVFHSLRRLLLEAYQSLPTWPLWPLREICNAWQEGWLKRVNRKIYDLEIDLTSVVWANPPAPLQSFFQPREVTPPAGQTLKAALRRSADARQALDGAILIDPSGKSISKRHHKRVFKGLRALYGHSVVSKDSPAYKQELEAWRQLLDANENGRKRKAILGLVRLRIERACRQVQRERSQVPRALWLMPTDLGNRLAVLDDYAEDRYGIDTTTFLLRLWGILPEDDRKEISDAQLGVQSALGLSMACYLVAAFGALAMAPIVRNSLKLPGGAVDAYAVVLVAGVALAGYVFYRAAVFSVAAFSERVIRAVDLHYLKFIAAMGVEAPASLLQAREILEELARFFVDAARPTNIQLSQDETSESPPARPLVSSEAPDVL